MYCRVNSKINITPQLGYFKKSRSKFFAFVTQLQIMLLNIFLKKDKIILSNTQYKKTQKAKNKMYRGEIWEKIISQWWYLEIIQSSTPRIVKNHPDEYLRKIIKFPLSLFWSFFYIWILDFLHWIIIFRLMAL